MLGTPSRRVFLQAVGIETRPIPEPDRLRPSPAAVGHGGAATVSGGMGAWLCSTRCAQDLRLLVEDLAELPELGGPLGAFLGDWPFLFGDRFGKFLAPAANRFELFFEGGAIVFELDDAVGGVRSVSVADHLPRLLIPRACSASKRWRSSASLRRSSLIDGRAGRALSRIDSRLENELSDEQVQTFVPGAKCGERVADRGPVDVAFAPRVFGLLRQASCGTRWAKVIERMA